MNPIKLSKLSIMKNGTNPLPSSSIDSIETYIALDSVML